jgi:glycosidase
MASTIGAAERHEIEVMNPVCPSLYQINTRVWLTEIARRLGRPATLDDVPDAALDELHDTDFDWIWFLSVWQTGLASQRISRSNPEWQKEFRDTLPDLSDEDIAGSGFAIASYTVHGNLGGDPALARLRERLAKRGLKLLLDFVPNHMALDHPWVQQHPDRFVRGTDSDLVNAPQNYCRMQTSGGSTVFAHGRDPYFPGWTDTLQLDYSNPATQDAMIGELQKIAGQCDGVRCDMAMLLLPDVFERTWGRRAPLFWPRAIESVRQRVPDFCFMAEVYWDLEWTMQQQGFDYAYDKRLYDRLRDGHAEPVREHLLAGVDYQNKLARFLENHDEPRAAATFPPDVHRAAAVITFLSPGLRFFHQGQFEGRRKRISPHLVRAPNEPIDAELRTFYDTLLNILRRDDVRNGRWQLLECAPAWSANDSCNDCLAWIWQSAKEEKLLIAVNYAAHQSQCFVRLPLAELGGRKCRLVDLLGTARYERDGDDLLARGLYLDVPGWTAHAFEMTS